ncbi:MAG: hypoxanthine phosphoribosyltransferase [Erysipelothrix sp.]|nr:hypoxanthine phosphoribosyltransferase [Erysipelothrix sp.]
MHKDIKRVIISYEQIEQRSKELAKEVEAYYEDKDAPLLVALLKGSIPFLAELIKHIELDIEYDFMDVSSYEGTESIGDVRILKDLDQSIKGLNILLVEDIVDTGRTVQEVTKTLFNKGANEVKIVSLLDKPSRRLVDVKADFVGFEIPNEFVVGFGLDFNEKYRQLGYVGILKDELYE